MLRDLCSFDYQLELEKYDIKELIGHSSFAYVLKAADKQTGEDIAIKIIKNSMIRNQEKINFQRNIMISSYLNIPGVIKNLGYRLPLSEDEKKDPNKIQSITLDGNNIDCTGYILFQELIKHRNISDLNKSYLNSKINNYETMNPTVRSKIIYGVASIMKKFHEKRQIHRDLKLESIFLDDRLEVKIGSLFFSKYVTNDCEMTMAIGTPYTMAPEIFMDTYDDDGDEIPYSFPVDVYSFAFILYRMFEDEIKFDNKRPIRSAQQYLMKISRGLRPLKPKSIPDVYWDLIQKCWKQNPNDRPTFDEIVEMLKNDCYALEEFGMKTNIEELHRYQKRMDFY